MDIQFYDKLYSALKEYNEKIGKPHGNCVLDEEPLKPSYPITIIEEIRNVADNSFDTCFDRVASVGYSINIYAQGKGKVTKKDIAREIAQKVDEFMTNFAGLKRVGFAGDGLVRDNSLHRIIMTYTGNLHENRQKIF